jgi:cyclase
MLTKRIIPCLDVDGGRVVKGISFLRLRDAGNPAEMAKLYDEEGADELVFLDITASSDHREIMVDVVREVSDQVFIPLTVGGGIRSVGDINRMLEAGADKISINTEAVRNPTLVKQAANQFGDQCIVVAIDARRRQNNDTKNKLSWEVYTHGGRKPTEIDVVEWANHMANMGAGELLITSMDADGHQHGYDLELIKIISETVSIPVIASGGAGNLDHLSQALIQGGADAVLAASIFHFGTYRIQEAKQFLMEKGIPMRIERELDLNE